MNEVYSKEEMKSELKSFSFGGPFNFSFPGSCTYTSSSPAANNLLG